MKSGLSKVIISSLLIAIPILTGLYVRYQAVPFWFEHKKEFFVEGKPIFSAFDSYLFARYAEDYKRDTFEPGGKDKLRFVPDYGKYPKVIPLLSWLSAKLSELFNISIENVSFWIMPLFAVLFIVPLSLFFLNLNLPFTAFAGGLTGVLAFIYVIRTSLNRFDTDSLVVFSVIAIPITVYFLSESNSKRKYLLYLLLLSLLVHIFYWWYIHPGLIFFLYIISIFGIYLKSFEFKNPLKGLNKNFFKLAILILLAFNPYLVLGGVSQFTSAFFNYFLHFGKPLDSFPNIQISISELKTLSLSSISEWTVGSILLFLISVLGLLIFFILRWRVAVCILPTVLLGLLTFKSGSRFAIFLAPSLGIGLGFLMDLLLKYLSDLLEKILFYVVVGILFIGIFGLILINHIDSFKFKSLPIMSSSLAKSFIELGKSTPPDAWIWTWWDFGYAIQYYARRATFHDGGSQFSPKTYFVALSLTISNQTAGYNVVKTTAVCGAQCIFSMLKEGKKPQEIKKIFEKGILISKKIKINPIYILFTPDLIPKFYWISYFGNWDFKKKKGIHENIISLNCLSKNFEALLCYNNVFRKPLYIDLRNMYALMPNNQQIPIKLFAIRTPHEMKINNNPYTAYGFALESVYSSYGKYLWYLTTLKTFEGNFNQLYLLRVYNRKLFQKVKDIYPRIVVYRVK